MRVNVLNPCSICRPTPPENSLMMYLVTRCWRRSCHLWKPNVHKAHCPNMLLSLGFTLC